MQLKLLGQIAQGLIALCGFLPLSAQETTVDLGGRLSYQLVLASFPEDSLFRELTGPESDQLDAALETSPAGCNLIDTASCLLPFPSDFLTVAKPIADQHGPPEPYLVPVGTLIDRF